MKNDGTQPSEIRCIIYNEGQITRGELKQKLKDRGYDVEVRKQHTGVSSVLRVLDNHTEEIEREGRGEDKNLKWVGENN